MHTYLLPFWCTMTYEIIISPSSSWSRYTFRQRPYVRCCVYVCHIVYDELQFFYQPFCDLKYWRRGEEEKKTRRIYLSTYYWWLVSHMVRTHLLLLVFAFFFSRSVNFLLQNTMCCLWNGIESVSGLIYALLQTTDVYIRARVNYTMAMNGTQRMEHFFVIHTICRYLGTMTHELSKLAISAEL